MSDANIGMEIRLFSWVIFCYVCECMPSFTEVARLASAYIEDDIGSCICLMTRVATMLPIP
jgi:hypothetical protein